MHCHAFKFTLLNYQSFHLGSAVEWLNSLINHCSPNWSEVSCCFELGVLYLSRSTMVGWCSSHRILSYRFKTTRGLVRPERLIL